MLMALLGSWQHFRNLQKYISFFTPLVTEFRINFCTKPCAPFLSTVSQTWLFCS